MRLARHACLILGLCWALVCCAQAKPPAAKPSQSDAQLRKQVVALLATKDAARELEKLGPDAVRVLEQLVGSAANTLDRRRKAVGALALLSSAEASEALRGILRERTVPASCRAQAATAIAHRDGKAALPELQPHLADDSVEVRAATARAVGYVAGPEARTALEERVGKEPDAKLREELQQLLARMHP